MKTEKPFRDKQEDVPSKIRQETEPKEKKNEVSVSEDKSEFKPSSSSKTVSYYISMEDKDKVDSDSKDDYNEEYAISQIIDIIRILKNETYLRPRITFLDFAGQNTYYAFHQIFLSPNACSILVVDMTKSLNEKVDVSDTHGKDCTFFESWTYKGN